MNREERTMEETTISIRSWNSSTSSIEETGEKISIYTLARSMTMDNFTRLFDEFLNLGGKQYAEGKVVGSRLRFTHRSLQRLAICFAFGIIVGLAEQEHTDPRNETAIETARKVKRMIDQGELPFGFYI
jgi:hypothetical protein